MTPVLLSVIVTAYQSENFLDDCLRSITSANYDRLQVVLVNDGSTDGTADICDRWAKTDPRIDLFHRKHEGRNSALQFAYQQAKGEALCVVDSDDIVLPRAFERSVAKLSDTYEIVYTYRDLIDAAGNRISSHNKNKIAYKPLQLLVDNMIFHLRTCTSNVFHRSGGVGRFERCEDWDQNLRMAELTQVRCIPQVLYLYRIHEHQISRTPQQNREGKVAVQEAIKRRGLPYDIVADESGFRLLKRKGDQDLRLP